MQSEYYIRSNTYCVNSGYILHQCFVTHVHKNVAVLRLELQKKWSKGDRAPPIDAFV